MWESQKTEALGNVKVKLNQLKPLLKNSFTPLKSYADSLSLEQYVSGQQIAEYSNYYKYFYGAIMGVNVFMLCLFLMYSLGIAGMCCRRKQSNYKQCGDRGTTANFLLAAAGLYFLLAWFLIIVCIGFFLPGIALRQFACKPALELESNELFNMLKAQPELKQILDFKSVGLDISSVNYGQLLIHCNLTSKSPQLESLFQKSLESKFKGEMNLDSLLNKASLKSFISDKLKKSDFSLQLNKMQKLLQSLTDETKINELKQINSTIAQIRKLPNEDSITDILKSVQDFAEAYESLEKQVKNRFVNL